MTIQEIKRHLDKIEKIDKPDDNKLTNQLTEEMSKFGILVFDDGNPYMKCDSYYQRLTDEEGKIVLQQLLSPSAQLRVPSAVITECYKRLSHSTDLQRDIRADFFKTQHLLNLKNGVYDIQKRELLKRDLSYQFDYVLNFSYKENITLENTPAFKSYVKYSIGEENLECLLRSTGYCISSLTKGRKAFLLFGLGKTGKSTWLNLIEEAVGDSFISHEPFHKMTSEQSKAKYIGKRINISCDSSSVPMRHEESFKSLISCEKTTGRNLYENSIDFLPTLKFAFASNEELHFSHPDDAIYDRLVLLPFTKKIPEEKLDFDLDRKLIEEKDAIFSMIVDHLKDLIASNYDFCMSDEAKELLQFRRLELHTVEDFLTENCNLKKDSQVSSTKLYAVYCDWCYSNGLTVIGRNKFYEKVRKYDKQIHYKKVKQRDKMVNGFCGLSLNPAILNTDNEDEKAVI